MNTIHNNSQKEKRSKKEKKSYDNHIMLWVTFLNDLTGPFYFPYILRLPGFTIGIFKRQRGQFSKL